MIAVVIRTFIIYCVVTIFMRVMGKRQLGELQEIIRKYPDTFSYIVPANEVYGMWRK